MAVEAAQAQLQAAPDDEQAQAVVDAIAARDADALAQSRRALPHYGQQGWVTISGGRTTARGQWPAATAWQRVCPH